MKLISYNILCPQFHNIDGLSNQSSVSSTDSTDDEIESKIIVILKLPIP